MDKGLLLKFTDSAKMAHCSTQSYERGCSAHPNQGQWKLGIVVKTFPSEDGRVRRVHVQYKNPKPGEAVNEYHGRGFVTVE